MHGQKSFNLRGVRLVMTPKKAFVLTAVFSVLGVFAVVVPGYASVGSMTSLVVGYILEPFLGFLGQMLLNVVAILIWVAQYNDFVNAAPVVTGWIIVRDITNMFFIIVLLIIAFGTMLGVDQYSYRNKVLSRFLIMAIVVNFSRTITGLLIDFAQVVMLTFVNGFKEAAGGNFIDALKIGDVMQTAAAGGETGTSDLVIGFMVALVMIAMSLFLMTIMLAVFVVRIVYLWLLIVLSPLAFFLKAVPIPAAQGYYAEWWKMFTQQVLVGPVLAFFLWLSLVSVSTGNLTDGFNKGSAATGESLTSTSAVFNAETMQEFIISFTLLLAGVMMAQRLSPQGVGVLKKAKGLAVAGAKQIDRRTGFAAARDSARADREQRYKETGAKIRGGYNRITAGIKGGLAGKDPKLRAAQGRTKLANLDKDIAEARRSGDVKGADKLQKQRNTLSGKVDTWDKKKRGFVGRRLAASAAKDRGIARRGGMSAMKTEMDDAKSMSDVELRSSMQEGGGSATQRRAAYLEAAGRPGGLPDEKTFQQGMAMMTDEGMKNTYRSTAGKSNPMYSERKDAMIQAGTMPMDNVSPEDIKKNSLGIATSPGSFKMMGKMDMTQMKEYNNGLREHQTSLSQAPEGESSDAKTTRLSDLGKVESALLQSNTGNRTEAAAAAGISGGKFAEADGDKGEARRARMAKALRGPSAAKIGSALPADQMFNDDGTVTDLGMQAAVSFSGNSVALNQMARDPNTETASIEAIVEAIKSAAERPPEGTSKEDTEKLQTAASRVEKSRSLEDFQSYEGVTGQRKERQATAQREQEETKGQEKQQQEQAEKKEGELKSIDVDITLKQDNISSLEEQIAKGTGALDNAGDDISKTGPIREELMGIQGRLNNLIEQRDKLQKRRDKLAKG